MQMIMIKNTQCRLVALQNIVQSNGKTFFILIIVPSKLSAYDNFLGDRKYAGLNVIDEVVSPGLDSHPALKHIEKEIKSCSMDVYLFNDTH
jgi:hypothetical protein